LVSGFIVRRSDAGMPDVLLEIEEDRSLKVANELSKRFVFSKSDTIYEPYEIKSTFFETCSVGDDSDDYSKCYYEPKKSGVS
jgi:hypothetical protein